MIPRTIRNWLVVLASLGLTTLGVLAGAEHHAVAPAHQTSVAEQLQFLPSGVFGWD